MSVRMYAITHFITVQVFSEWKRGNHEGANHAFKEAKGWSIIGIFMVVMLGPIILVIVATITVPIVAVVKGDIDVVAGDHYEPSDDIPSDY